MKVAERFKKIPAKIFGKTSAHPAIRSAGRERSAITYLLSAMILFHRNYPFRSRLAPIIFHDFMNPLRFVARYWSMACTGKFSTNTFLVIVSRNQRIKVSAI
jgi:hypothetical protein